MNVALFDLDEERGNIVASEIGGVFYKVNLTDDACVAAGFAAARAAHGQERILVDCAGTGNAIKTANRDKKPAKPSIFRSTHSTRSFRPIWWEPFGA